ncbi:hypothetical protein [Parafrankia soli]|uniref:hypothetical protein n=1 Tax=Parafrankia soli TaxID=2599596 RepID=UPI0010423325|nr:hypothetical protein [Parafrankia soli]
MARRLTRSDRAGCRGLRDDDVMRLHPDLDRGDPVPHLAQPLDIPAHRGTTWLTVRSAVRSEISLRSSG